MRDEPGFERYAAHGGDLGAGVTSRLAEAHPEALAGIHLLAVAPPAGYDPDGLTPQDAGLLAWIVEKYRAWSDCGGDLSSRFSDDFILTQASLYWFTGTISTSFRPCCECAHGLTRRVERVNVPTAVALFPADLSRPPRSWAERTYNITRYTRMPRDGTADVSASDESHGRHILGVPPEEPNPCHLPGSLRCAGPCRQLAEK